MIFLMVIFCTYLLTALVVSAQIAGGSYRTFNAPQGCNVQEEQRDGSACSRPERETPTHDL